MHRVCARLPEVSCTSPPLSGTGHCETKKSKSEKRSQLYKMSETASLRAWSGNRRAPRSARQGNKSLTGAPTARLWAWPLRTLSAAARAEGRATLF